MELLLFDPDPSLAKSFADAVRPCVAIRFVSGVGREIFQSHRVDALWTLPMHSAELIDSPTPTELEGKNLFIRPTLKPLVAQFRYPRFVISGWQKESGPLGQLPTAAFATLISLVEEFNVASVHKIQRIAAVPEMLGIPSDLDMGRLESLLRHWDRLLSRS